jgi:hypothetical protein
MAPRNGGGWDAESRGQSRHSGGHSARFGPAAAEKGPGRSHSGHRRRRATAAKRGRSLLMAVGEEAGQLEIDVKYNKKFNNSNKK